MLRLFCHLLEQSQPHPLNGHSATFPEKGVLHSCSLLRFKTAPAAEGKATLPELQQWLPIRIRHVFWHTRRQNWPMRIKDKITVPIHNVHRRTIAQKVCWKVHESKCVQFDSWKHINTNETKLNQTTLPMPVSPRGVSGNSACHFRNCWSSDELWIFQVGQATFKYGRAVQSPLYFFLYHFHTFLYTPETLNPKP